MRSSIRSSPPLSSQREGGRGNGGDGNCLADKTFLDKMLKKRKFVRQSLCNFHFDRVLPDLDIQSNSLTGFPSRGASVASKQAEKRSTGGTTKLDPVRIQAMRRATPWIERVAVMRCETLGLDATMTQKILSHLEFAIVIDDDDDDDDDKTYLSTKVAADTDVAAEDDEVLNKNVNGDGGEMEDKTTEIVKTIQKERVPDANVTSESKEKEEEKREGEEEEIPAAENDRRTTEMDKNKEDDTTTTLEVKLAHFSMGSTRHRLVMESLAGDYGRIERLNCRGNRLRGRDIAILLRNASERMVRLRHLDLSENKFAIESVDAMRGVLESCLNLTSLSLSKCSLSDSMSVRLEEYLFRRDSGCYLESIDLSSNEFRDVALKNLAHTIKLSASTDDDVRVNGSEHERRETASQHRHIRALRHFNISHTTFARNAADEFVRSIAKCSLHSLHLESTALGRGGIVDALAIALEENNSLRVLNVAFNNISPAQTLILSDAFAKHANLASLNMSGNPIGQLGIRSLLRSIVAKKNPLDSFVRWQRQRRLDCRDRSSSRSTAKYYDNRCSSRSSDNKREYTYEWKVCPPHFNRIDVSVEQCALVTPNTSTTFGAIDVLSLKCDKGRSDGGVLSFKLSVASERALASEIIAMAGSANVFTIDSIRHNTTSIHLRPVTCTLAYLKSEDICTRCGNPGHASDQCRQIRSRCAAICLNCGARHMHDTEDCDHDFVLPGTKTPNGGRNHVRLPTDGVLRMTVTPRTSPPRLTDECDTEIQRKQRTVTDAIVDALIRTTSHAASSPIDRHALLKYVLKAVLVTRPQADRLLNFVYPHTSATILASRRRALEQELARQRA
eukprot:g4683.t1